MIYRGALGYVLVLLGGLVTSVLPASSAVAEAPVVGALRATMPGRILGLVVVVVGLGLATAAWFQLVRYVGAGERPAATAQVRAADARRRELLVRRCTMAWAAPLLLAPAMFSRDGWSYAAQGELTRLGLSPYRWTPAILEGPIVEAVDPRWMDTPTPYGPVPLVWGALGAMLSDGPWFLVVAHRVLALAGLAMLAYAVPRLASWARRDTALASALVLPSPLMMAHGVAGLHNDLLMVGLMALALVVAIEHSWVAGAVLGGLAAAVKLPGGLVCIGVVLVSLPLLASPAQRLRRTGAVAVLAVGTLLLVGSAAGVGAGWVHALGVPGEVRTPLSATTQVGQLLDWVLSSLGIDVLGDRALRVVRALGSLVALLLAVHVGLRGRTGVPAAAVRAVALVMAGVLALSPVVHPWYVLWCLPLLATCHLSRRGAGAVLHLSWLLGLIAPLDSSLEGAGRAITVTVVLIAAVAWIQLRNHRSATAATTPRSAQADYAVSRP